MHRRCHKNFPVLTIDKKFVCFIYGPDLKWQLVCTNYVGDCLVLYFWFL